METRLITINPWLYTKSGHNLIYIKSMEDAAKELGWSFKALLPKKNAVDALPNNWSKCIDCPTVRHWYETIEKKTYKRDRKVNRAKQRLRYYITLFMSLKKSFIKGKNILFLETFAITDIRLITNLLTFLPKKNLSLWLLYRYPSTFMQNELELYKACHKEIKKKNIYLKLITDSELLAKDLSSAFEEKVHVFPIPHVEDIKSDPNKKNDLIQCWWPGLAREGKGQKIIQNFAKSCHSKNSLFHLLAAKNANLTPSEKGPKVSILPKELSREEYLDHFINSDLILLPYIDSCYEKSTSGIFVETIMAGKTPVVYPNTWMAYELNRFSLQSLIIDWSEETLAEKLFEIYQDCSIQDKLRLMRKNYLNYHSMDSFTQEIKQLAFA